MTATTTIKLPAELKSRIKPLAAQEGKTPHAWMVDALKTQAELAELRRGFIRDALESAAEVDAGGPLFALEDVSAYLRARAAGRAVKRPKPVKAAGQRAGSR